MRKLVLVGLLFLLFSCAGPSKYEMLQRDMPQNIGRWTIDNAISVYGLPTKTMEIGERTAYSWEKISYRNIRAVNLWTGQPLPFSRTVEEGSELILFFDKSGIMVDWQYREW